MTTPPSGTVTFLFTDLEGSTRLWQEHPEAMKAALARHDEIVRDAIESHGGHVVKTTGDGFHGAFASAPDAVQAAIAAQRALGDEPWTDTGPLAVRVGVHTGHAELRDGDYYGTAVNRAARLMSAAHGGQVVVSLATEELVQDTGIELVDLGEHNLRDLARAERVFQVVAENLAHDFPRLQSLDSFAGNLPLQTTSFVGRDAELVAVASAVDTTRLVTLTGVGGVGKTRLSLQVAAEVLPRFRHGAWFCELVTAVDEASLLEVVVSTLGVTPLPEMSLERSIVEFLRSKAQLLVLDNCEHLLDDVSHLAEVILRECAAVRILASSREGLGVPGEQMVAVRSLRVPRVDDDVDAIVDSAAVELFVERAAAARGGFIVEPSNALEVAEICRRLDGIPLAIELAAARVRSMNPSDIAAHLDERFRLLTGGRRSAIERHQTLRATVDWSYSLLDPTEQAVFDRLGVFSGGFDAAGASDVVSDDAITPWDVLDALASLVAKSMVTLDDSAEGDARYHMLETLRAYARERLDEHGGTDEWRRRHARRIAEFAESLAPRLRGRDELAARRALRAELDNVRAAVTWSLDRDDADDMDLGVRTIVALAPETTLDRSTGYGTWAEHAIRRVTRWLPGTRSVTLSCVADAATNRGDPELGIELANEAFREAAPGDPQSLIPVIMLGAAWLSSGRPDDAIRVVEDALGVFETLEDMEYERANLLAVAAIFRASSGRALEARAGAEESVRLARRIGNPSQLAISLGTLGLVLVAEDPRAASAPLEESVALTAGGASDVLWSMVQSGLAVARTAAGDRRGGLECVRAAIVYAVAQANGSSIAFALAEGLAPVIDVVRTDLVLASACLFESQGWSSRYGELYAGFVDRARSTVNAARRAELQAQFAGMSFDEGVHVVLSELDCEIDACEPAD
jgi:predicted ATPase/class 3 adenylate cyclase